ncbi:hypothetical protein IIC65_07285, partial [Candidatus Sumerlaeota bacterium]|nr:hypothetical protein [Candidatus Sumerlaeota bacterium]
RARRPHTIPAVLRCLEAKELVIVAAAEAALIQFVTPPPRPKAYERLIMNLIGEPKLLRGARLERLLQIMARHFPKQEPYDGVFKKQVAIELEEGELTHRLLGAIHTGEKAEPEQEEGEEDGSKKKKPKGPALTTAETRQETMQLKRQFLEQRRAWVRGGKKGPEPKPPPGFH